MSTENNNKTPEEAKSKRPSAREEARKMASKTSSEDKKSSLFLRIGVVGVALAIIAALSILVVNQSGDGGSYTAGAATPIASEAGGIMLTSDDEVEEQGGLSNEVDAENLPNHVAPYNNEEREAGEKPHVTIYTDPSCPHCSTFEQQNHGFIEDMLSQELITVEYRPVAFMDGSSGGYSSRAANAFVCMAEESPESFSGYLGDIISAGEQVSGSALATHAEENYGADISECIDDSRYRAMVSYTTNLASQSGVTGTPTVLMNGQNWQEQGTSFPEFVSGAVDEYQEELDSGATAEDAESDTEASEGSSDETAEEEDESTDTEEE